MKKSAPSVLGAVIHKSFQARVIDQIFGRISRCEHVANIVKQNVQVLRREVVQPEHGPRDVLQTFFREGVVGKPRCQGFIAGQTSTPIFEKRVGTAKR